MPGPNWLVVLTVSAALAAGGLAPSLCAGAALLSGPPQTVRVWRIEGRTFALDPGRGVLDLDLDPPGVALAIDPGMSASLSVDGRFALRVARDGHAVTRVTRHDLLGRETDTAIPLPTAPPVFDVIVAPATGWVAALTSLRPPTGPPKEPRLCLVWPDFRQGPDIDVTQLQWTDDGRHLLITNPESGSRLLTPDLQTATLLAGRGLTALSANGESIIHVSRAHPERAELHVADATGEHVAPEPVAAAAVSPNGGWFALARGGQMWRGSAAEDGILAAGPTADEPGRIAKLLITDSGETAALFCRDDPAVPGKTIATAVVVARADGAVIRCPLDQLADVPALPSLTWREPGTIQVNAGSLLLLVPASQDGERSVP